MPRAETHENGRPHGPHPAGNGRPAPAGNGRSATAVLEARPRDLEQALAAARERLLAQQHADGYWHFELEADCTIPSEYVLMMHFMDEIDEELQRRLAVYVRAHQNESGGWSLYPGGEDDLSCTVKAYWALKLAGDDPAAPHMARAREAVLARGGAARCNVFTRIALALFGQIPWRGVPFVPVEIVLLPRWFPFHLSKVSYWSRTVMVPLAILCSLKARARNPRGVDVRELFAVPPEEERDYFRVRSGLNRCFLLCERTARRFEPLIPGFVRRHALRRAERWFVARLNGEDGLGGIFPAMVNAYEALDLLGYPRDHELCVTARAALRKLLVRREHDAYCQPCLSPIWDTALASLALQEELVARPGAGRGLDEQAEHQRDALRRAHVWLLRRQVRSGPADWRDYRPHLAPGGWPFEFGNSYYPDLDDTSAVAWALQRSDAERFAESLQLAADWLVGMQSRDGGFASFDADNTQRYLNHIPFADHGALLDPPTADVSARCITFLALRGDATHAAALERCVQYLYDQQEPDGSWFGRWGTNYVYGTWSALCALETLRESRWAHLFDRARERRAVEWLLSVQREDGSWGESNDSYADPSVAGRAERGTSFQTAWALLGLLAAGEGDSPAVRRGVAWLLAHQREDGLWNEPTFTAPGFPRVFYLRYHGYGRFFPLWALARYRRALAAG